MKMKLKLLLVTAVAALGVSSQAFATYTDGNGVNGSSLILNVWDTVTKESYSATLEIPSNNLTYSTFNGGPTFTALAGNSTFTGLFGNNNAADIRWNIAADLNDVLAGGTPGANIPWSLGFTAASLPASLNGSQMNAANVKFNTWVNLLNGHQTATGSGLTTSTDATQLWNMNNASAAWGGTNGGGTLPFSITGLLGDSLSYFQATANGRFAADASTFAQIAGTWSLASSGTLTWNEAPIGAVPVPAAAWLLGSGLMGLVGVGRRRATKGVAA
jgi:hypothetical protein